MTQTSDCYPFISGRKPNPDLFAGTLRPAATTPPPEHWLGPSEDTFDLLVTEPYLSREPLVRGRQ